MSDSERPQVLSTRLTSTDSFPEWFGESWGEHRSGVDTPSLLARGNTKYEGVVMVNDQPRGSPLGVGQELGSRRMFRLLQVGLRHHPTPALPPIAESGRILVTENHLQTARQAQGFTCQIVLGGDRSHR